MRKIHQKNRHIYSFRLEKQTLDTKHLASSVKISDEVKANIPIRNNIDFLSGKIYHLLGFAILSSVTFPEGELEYGFITSVKGNGVIKAKSHFRKVILFMLIF